MNKQTIITALFALVAMAGQAQATFDTDEGCLNVVDFTYGKGIGEYGDRCISANYMHERFINEQLCIGLGIGYSHHKEYKFSAIPVYLSSHYFFLDKRFSPLVNLRVGGFALFNAKNVGTNENSLCLTRRMLELTRNIPFPKIIRILAYIYHPALASRCILHRI